MITRWIQQCPRVVALSLLPVVVGCRSSAHVPHAPTHTVLRVGVAGGGSQVSRQFAANQIFEGLVKIDHDGRTLPWLADRVSQSDDRLTVRIHLSPALFHDQSPLTSAVVREILMKRLPEALGPAAQDVREITTPSDRELLFTLRRPSAFLLEGLDIPIEKSPGSGVGTGAYKLAQRSTDGLELEANTSYSLGPPALARVRFKPYPSVRAAWADLLRGEVDALYEVGVEALDSLRPSGQVRVFSYRRHYAQLVMLNFARPVWRDRVLRTRLNAAVDRRKLVNQILAGNGAPAEGPVWEGHWAYPSALEGFVYEPEAHGVGNSTRVSFTCLVTDLANERLALAVQRQVQAIGIDMALEQVSPQEALKRLQSGDFDAILSDFIQGPSLARPYLFWHSEGPFNYGRYRSPAVDAALDSVRHAVSDEAYKSGVADFQRAIMHDPPAIFLVWTDRARAVSTSWDVPTQATRDVWTSLRLWRPALDDRVARSH